MEKKKTGGDAGGQWQTLTFPDGMYDYTDINRFMQGQTGFVDPGAENKEHIFSLYFNFTLFRVVLLKHKDYEIHLSEGEFANLLGFEKRVLGAGTNFTGNKIPNILRAVDWVFLHYDLITRQANDMPSDVLFSLSTAGLQVSYPFSNEPRRLKFHPIKKTRIDSVGLRVTDGRNNPLELNDVDVAFSLMIEEE